ncbi:MAG: hypothetical protein Q4G05_06935, partial [Clostridia bacterium]|nr:hypothetical protein [Clostridia bacterium]
GRGAEIFSGSNFDVQKSHNCGKSANMNCGQNVDTNSHLSPLTSYCSYLTSHHSGITLIALIITIVIMLILAGITINLTLGENGIFQKAKLAKSEYEVASIKEHIALEVGNIAISNGTNEDVLVLLGKNGELLYEDEENDKKVTAINIKGVRVEVSELYDKDVINKYKDVNQGDFINYDAGDWSESQIQNLKNLGLYAEDITTGFTTNVYNSYTFQGFTYRDNVNAANSRYRHALKSRNASLIQTANYSGISLYNGGWRVRNNPKQDGYIELISAGAPELYTYNFDGEDNGQDNKPYGSYISDYVLSGGTKNGEYLEQFGIEKNGRQLDMYENSFSEKDSAHVFSLDEYNKDKVNITNNINFNYWFHYLGTTVRGRDAMATEPGGRIILTYDGSGNNQQFRGIRVILSLKNNIEVEFDDDGVVYKDGETSIYDATNDGEVNNTGAWQIQN